MICEGRLAGSIDQIQNLVMFDDAANSANQWDAAIQDVCVEVNNTLGLIEQEHPDWLQQRASKII